MTRNRVLVLAALAVTLFLAAVVSRYASGSPDGLEKVARDKGIAARETEHRFSRGPLSGYATRGVGDDRLSGALAGVAGVGITLAAGGALFYAVRRRSGDRAGGGRADADRAGGGGDRGGGDRSGGDRGGSGADRVRSGRGRTG